MTWSSGGGEVLTVGELHSEGELQMRGALPQERVKDALRARIRLGLTGEATTSAAAVLAKPEEDGSNPTNVYTNHEIN